MKRLLHHIHKRLTHTHSHHGHHEGTKHLRLQYIISMILIGILTYISYEITTAGFWRFAMTTNTFQISDITQGTLSSVLQKNYVCPVSTSIWAKCGYDYILNVIIFLILESITMFVIYTKRKHANKGLLSLFFIFQHILLGGIFMLYQSIPPSIVNKLGLQATQEIRASATMVQDTSTQKNAGIISAIDEISVSIQQAPDVPAYFEFEPVTEALLQVLNIDHTQKQSFYKAIIIPNILYTSESTEIKKQIKFDALYFTKTNTLIINTVSQSYIDKIAPILAKKLIESTYKSAITVNTPAPKIAILENDAYIKLMQKKESERKAYYQKTIKEIESSIQTATNDIQKLTEAINADEKEYARYETYGKQWMTNCETTLNKEDTMCTEGQSKIDASLKKLQELKSTYETQIQALNIYKPKATASLKQWQHAYQEFLKDPITPEYQAGMFESPNNIYIKWNPTLHPQFSYYINTIMHELLHYEHPNTKTEFPVYLEEGITDYVTTKLTRKLLAKQTLTTPTIEYTGYKELVNIIERLNQKMTEDRLLQEYFNRNTTQIQALVDTTYKKGTYTKLTQLGNQLYFTPLSDTNTKSELIGEITNILP